MRRLAVIVLMFCLIILVFAGLSLFVSPPTTERPSTADVNDSDIFRLEGYESGIWPYNSPSTEFRKRSPINVIVRGNTSTVVQLLQERTDTEWNVTTVNQTTQEVESFSIDQINLTGTRVEWGETGGAARYAYVHDGEEGQWIRETTQLHHGDYYGYRIHIRLYNSPHPEEEWVAMQVHTEHFDWFTLRHAVDGVQSGQRQVELEFLGQPYVDGLWREYLGNDGPSDSDGWATVVELATAAMLVTVLGSIRARRIWEDRLDPLDRQRVRAIRDRITLEPMVLGLVITGMFLGVRVSGIVLERYVPALSMHGIAALLYPVIGLGIPVATYLIASHVRRRFDAGVTAATALAVAFFIDYGAIGVTSLPIQVVMHRIGVILALGLIAAGSAEGSREERGRSLLLVGGLLLWVVLLTGALLQWW
ncbi:MAG: hypothetical protein U5K37_03855 [Natrialbaceae archaeon]|nr:hypothetical protein [Natrialbaceae archaeon]